MIYAIVGVCYISLLVLFNPSGWVQNKIFDRRLSNIKYCCRLSNDESMNIAIIRSSKFHGFNFNISIQDEKHNSISILTTYTSSSVYINDEKVCTIHRLHKVFHISRSIEYSDDRKIDEIDRIIKHANAHAKKRIDEYNSNSRIARDKNKSLFD